MINRACISLGEKCNIRCKYCHFHKRLSKDNQEFNESEMISIVENVRKYMDENKVESFKIGIVGAGEPILEFNTIKALINYVKRVKEQRISFYTISNSLLVDEDILNYFYENRSLISLNYSYDGPELIHNYGRGQFEKVFSRIMEYEQRFGKKPSINSTIHRKSIDCEDELLGHFEEMQFSNITFSRIVDTKDPNFKITQKEYDDFLIKAKDYNINVRQNLPCNEKKIDCTMYGNICGVGITSIFFTRMGVYPCGRFYGNSKYRHGNFDDDLNLIENKMKKITPVGRGKCYFDFNNIGE